MHEEGRADDEVGDAAPALLEKSPSGTIAARRGFACTSVCPTSGAQASAAPVTSPVVGSASRGLRRGQGAVVPVPGLQVERKLNGDTVITISCDALCASTLEMAVDIALRQCVTPQASSPPPHAMRTPRSRSSSLSSMATARKADKETSESFPSSLNLCTPPGTPSPTPGREKDGAVNESTISDTTEPVAVELAVQPDPVLTVFEHFDRDADGHLSYTECCELQRVTDPVALPLMRADWEMMCRQFGCEPRVGLTLEGLRQAYASGLGLAEHDACLIALPSRAPSTFGLNLDTFKFPYSSPSSDAGDVPGVETIFNMFDDNQDGFLDRYECSRLRAATETTPYGSMSYTEWDEICMILGGDIEKGITVDQLMEAYKLGWGVLAADLERVGVVTPPPSCTSRVGILVDTPSHSRSSCTSSTALPRLNDKIQVGE